MSTSIVEAAKDAVVDAVTAAIKLPGRMAAQRRYKQSVKDGICDPDTNFAYQTLDSEWQADREKFELRVGACEDLKTKVPELEAKAAEARRAVADAERFARNAIDGDTTVAQLRERLQTAGYKGPLNRPTELAVGLQFFIGHVDGLKTQAIRATAAVSDVKQQALLTLRRTAADTAADPQEAALVQKIQAIEARMAARRETIEAEGKIPLLPSKTGADAGRSTNRSTGVSAGAICGESCSRSTGVARWFAVAIRP